MCLAAVAAEVRGDGADRASPVHRLDQAGLWPRLHRAVLDELGSGQVDWSRAIVDSASVRAEKGGADRAEPGRSRQTRLENPRPVRPHGLPLSWGSPRRTSTTASGSSPGHGIPAIRSRRGPRRRQPGKLHADKAYDHADLRAGCASEASPRIARRGIESSERLGTHRWKIERTIAWLFGYRRLTIRYERKATTSAPSSPSQPP